MTPATTSSPQGDLFPLEARKEEVLEKIRRIERANEYWKSCNDGSYEQALAHSGYRELCQELRQIEEELKKGGE